MIKNAVLKINGNKVSVKFPDDDIVYTNDLFNTVCFVLDGEPLYCCDTILSSELTLEYPANLIYVLHEKVGPVKRYDVKITIDRIKSYQIDGNEVTIKTNLLTLKPTEYSSLYEEEYIDSHDVCRVKINYKTGAMSLDVDHETLKLLESMYKEELRKWKNRTRVRLKKFISSSDLLL